MRAAGETLRLSTFTVRDGSSATTGLSCVGCVAHECWLVARGVVCGSCDRQIKGVLAIQLKVAGKRQLRSHFRLLRERVLSVNPDTNSDPDRRVRGLLGW